MPRSEFVAGISALLDGIQQQLLDRAKAYRAEHTREIISEAEFIEFFTPQNKSNPEIHGGFATMGFCCDAELEQRIAKEHKVSVRCIPIATQDEVVPCVFTGQPGKRVLFAKSY